MAPGAKTDDMWQLAIISHSGFDGFTAKLQEKFISDVSPRFPYTRKRYIFYDVINCLKYIVENLLKILQIIST